MRKLTQKKGVSPAASWAQWFDRCARHYKDPRMKMAYYDDGKPLPMRVMNSIHKDVWKKLRANKNSSLLDVGCGAGLFIKSFCRRLKYTAGVDISLPMLAEAKKKNPRSHFLSSALSHLPFKSKSFDRILCYSVFHYLPDEQAAKTILDEFRRVVADNGFIFIGDVLLPDDLSKENIQRFISKRNLKGTAQSAWWPKQLEHNLQKKKFSPSFFLHYAKKCGCPCEILQQHIAGKITAVSRYDIILKPGHK